MFGFNAYPSRRAMLRSVSAGFGYLAFAGLSQAQVARAASTNPLSPKEPHFPAKAKRVIFLCMQGGPSHVDTFDYKPNLGKNDGKSPRGMSRLMASPWAFQQHGESGLWRSSSNASITACAASARACRRQ